MLARRLKTGVWVPGDGGAGAARPYAQLRAVSSPCSGRQSCAPKPPRRPAAGARQPAAAMRLLRPTQHAMCSKREGSEALCGRDPAVLGDYSVAAHAA